MREISQRWLEGSVICIGTNEEWIPWELIYDDDNFWGRKFILCRRPKVSKKRFSNSDKAVERSSSKDLRKITNIIGGNLTPSKVVERIKTLFRLYQESVHIETMEKATTSEVLESIIDADLIHFTCHGHTNPCYLQLGEHLCISYRLTLHNLETLSGLPNSIVFANSCSSATIEEFLEDLITFGWGFYKKGAAAYIGTLGLVPTEYAISFAEYFYEKLQAGCTVGESLRYAKLQSGGDNPFWLLYTLYGDPFSQKVVINK